MGWAVIGFLGLVLLSGTGLAYVFGAGAVLSFLITDNARYFAILPQRILSKIDVFAYMAMPLFILTGEIMNRAGITQKLIDFSMTIVGRFKGGLGHVNILTSVFFAGISGSAIADAAALSNTLVPAMRKRGYSTTYAAAVTVGSSVIGPIIPPSIILIIYGGLMQTSVAALFVAGIIPGLLMAIALLALNSVLAHTQDHPGGRDEVLPPFLPTLWNALPALSLPVIILGGIVGGVVTPTEASALAVITAIGVGWFYGSITWEVMWTSLERTAILAGSIFMILAAVSCLGYIAALEEIPQSIASLVSAAELSGQDYVLLLMGVFLASGMVMDIPVAMALLVPILAPAALAQGVDPIHLGVVICLNLTLGLITPPLGGCLMIVSTITGLGYWRLAVATLPFAIVNFAVLLVIVFNPELASFLPRWLGIS